MFCTIRAEDLPEEPTNAFLMRGIKKPDEAGDEDKPEKLVELRFIFKNCHKTKPSCITKSKVTALIKLLYAIYKNTYKICLYPHKDIRAAVRRCLLAGEL